MLKRLDPPLDFMSGDYKRDPRPTLARMHALGEIVPAKIPIFGNVLLVVSHAGVSAFLKNNRRFVQHPANAGIGWVNRLQPFLPRTVRAVSGSIVTQDDPEHRRLRGLVDQAFSRRGIEVLGGRIGEIADQLLGRMDKHGQFDLVEHFARRLPLMVIAELLGLPSEDHDRLHTWAQGLVKGTSLASLAMTVPRIARMGRYIRKEIATSRIVPRSGLLKELIAADAGGERLNDDEILGMVFLLFFAGHETTSHLISVGTRTLLQHPNDLERLKDAAVSWPGAIEELLRYTSVVEMSKPRYVAEAGEFLGIDLRRGQMMFAHLAAANSDPEVFDEPDRFDIDREPNPHLAFGTGVHFCLGHQLARLEGQIALQRLFTRFPDLSLAVADDDLSWTANLGLRGVNTLLVKSE